MKNYVNEIKRFNYLLGETDALYHEISLKLGLSDSAMKILYAICDMGESRMLQEICRYSGLSKQTVNSAIRKMEKENIVYLENSDKKSKTVHLTALGKKLANKTAIKLIKMENTVFESWSDEDVAKYLSLSEKYLKDLKMQAEKL